MITEHGDEVQASPQTWSADFPAASNLLTPTFGCRLATPSTGPELNSSRFCDRRTRALMNRALELQRSDPTAVDALWAAADRRIVDEAAAVPVVNPKEIDVLSPPDERLPVQPTVWAAVRPAVDPMRRQRICAAAAHHLDITFSVCSRTTSSR